MTGNIRLRDVTEDDLPIFFAQQLDAAANRMAAFAARDPGDREAFMAHWSRILGDDTISIQTIVHERRVAGYVLKHEQFGQPEVSYWLGKDFWGKGLATQALAAFLAYVTVRPLYAQAARDNIGSIRVLEKCGFMVCGEDKEFSHARGEEVAEVVLVLR